MANASNIFTNYSIGRTTAQAGNINRLDSNVSTVNRQRNILDQVNRNLTSLGTEYIKREQHIQEQEKKADLSLAQKEVEHSLDLVINKAHSEGRVTSEEDFNDKYYQASLSKVAALHGDDIDSFDKYQASLLTVSRMKDESYKHNQSLIKISQAKEAEADTFFDVARELGLQGAIDNYFENKNGLLNKEEEQKMIKSVANQLMAQAYKATDPERVKEILEIGKQYGLTPDTYALKQLEASQAKVFKDGGINRVKHMIKLDKAGLFDSSNAVEIAEIFYQEAAQTGKPIKYYGLTGDLAKDSKIINTENQKMIFRGATANIFKNSETPLFHVKDYAQTLLYDNPDLEQDDPALFNMAQAMVQINHESLDSVNNVLRQDHENSLMRSDLTGEKLANLYENQLKSLTNNMLPAFVYQSQKDKFEEEQAHVLGRLNEFTSPAYIENRNKKDLIALRKVARGLNLHGTDNYNKLNELINSDAKELAVKQVMKIDDSKLASQLSSSLAGSKNPIQLDDQQAYILAGVVKKFWEDYAFSLNTEAADIENGMTVYPSRESGTLESGVLKDSELLSQHLMKRVDIATINKAFLTTGAYKEMLKKEKKDEKITVDWLYNFIKDEYGGENFMLTEHQKQEKEYAEIAKEQANLKSKSFNRVDIERRKEQYKQADGTFSIDTVRAKKSKRAKY